MFLVLCLELLLKLFLFSCSSLVVPCIFFVDWLFDCSHLCLVSLFECVCLSPCVSSVHCLVLT